MSLHGSVRARDGGVGDTVGLTVGLPVGCAVGFGVGLGVGRAKRPRGQSAMLDARMSCERSCVTTRPIADRVIAPRTGPDGADFWDGEWEGLPSRLSLFTLIENENGLLVGTE